jgi:RNA polymerase sigma-70 factor (ECF subfamily)
VTSITHHPDASERNSEREAAQLDVGINHSKVAELIRIHYSGLLTLVSRKLKNREFAADLVNEAIVITLEQVRVGRLSQSERIAGYVFKVSMNLLRNHARNIDNRHDLRSNIDMLETLATQDSDDIESTQIRRKAQQVIEALSSARDREVVKRFYLDEEDKEAICDALGLTPLQFTQVMSRARQRMKSIFESQGLKRSDLLSLLPLFAMH